MHRIVPLFLAVLFTSTLFVSAQEIDSQESVSQERATEKTWHIDARKARDAAKQLQRPMVISVESDGCIFCETMRDSTWSEPGIEVSLQSHFVALRLDKAKHKELVSKLKLKRFPATIIYSAAGKMVAKKEGMMFAGECRKWLDKVEDELNIVKAEALVQAE